eukprot:5986538-Alexandrium_andersonii.AAC.1
MYSQCVITYRNRLKARQCCNQPQSAIRPSDSAIIASSVRTWNCAGPRATSALAPKLQKDALCGT